MIEPLRRAAPCAALLAALAAFASPVRAAGGAEEPPPPAPKEAPKEPAKEPPKEEPKPAEEAAPPAIGAPEMPEMTVTATRTRRDPFDLPMSISVFDRRDLEGPGSFVAMKGPSRRDAGIWFDERTSTTSDPVIRGFAGFNLLTLVDGNTLTTLWGEGGFGADDMYGKIEAETVDRIEILRGPSSAMYGANALGAVINVITRRGPLDFQEEGYAYGARSKATFESAANSVGFRQEFFGAGKDFKYLIGGSARDFDDVRGGGGLGQLDPSDGRERNWDFSGDFRVAEGRVLRLTYQDVHRDHLKRFYRPTQDNAADREAVGLFYEDAKGNRLWDEAEFRLYHQYKRDERRFFNNGTRGEAITKTYAAGARATRDVGGGHVVTGGLSFELDQGDSPDDEQFTIYFPGPKRRDAPKSDWYDAGLYLQDEWAVHPKWSLVGSARYDRMLFKTDVDGAYSPPAGDPRADAIRENQGALTGGLGAVYKATEKVHLTANWSRGFRQNAPNFGLRQLGDGVLIPNGFLDPTTSDNFELGVKTRARGVSGEVAVYRSEIRNWQGDLRKVASYRGETFHDFDGDSVQDINESFIQQTEGADAFVQGVEVRARWQPHAHLEFVPPSFSLDGSFAWNRGRVDPTDAHPYTEHLRHTQPTRALLGVRWDEIADPERGLWVEVRADMVDRYSKIPGDRRVADLAWRRDAQDGSSPYLRDYIGTPGYTLFHIYAGLNLAEGTRLTLGIENIFDKRHRVAHSRMDAPGVSYLAGLEIWF